MVDRHVHQAAIVNETANRIVHELDEPSRQQLYLMGALASDTPIPHSVAFTDGTGQANIRQTLLERKLIQVSESDPRSVQVPGHVSLVVRHLVSPDAEEAFRVQAQERYCSQEQGAANTPEGWGFYLNAAAHAVRLRVVESDQPTARSFWDRIVLANAASGNFSTSVQLARTAYDTWESGKHHAGMAWRLAIDSNHIGDHQMAARYAHKASVEHQAHRGDDEPALAYRIGLGRTFYFRDNIPMATSIFRQLLQEGRQRLETPNPTDTGEESLAPVLLNISQIDFDGGRYSDAYRGAHEARLIRETTVGTEHRFTLMDMAREARAQAHAGAPKEAEELLRRANERLSSSVGEAHHDTIYATAALAEALRLNGDTKEGDQIASENYDRARGRYGTQSHVAACAGQVAIGISTPRWTI